MGKGVKVSPALMSPSEPDILSDPEFHFREVTLGLTYLSQMSLIPLLPFVPIIRWGQRIFILLL